MAQLFRHGTRWPPLLAPATPRLVAPPVLHGRKHLTHLSIYLSTYLSNSLSVYLSIKTSCSTGTEWTETSHSSIHLSIYPSIHPSIYPSIDLSIYRPFTRKHLTHARRAALEPPPGSGRRLQHTLASRRRQQRMSRADATPRPALPPRLSCECAHPARTTKACADAHSERTLEGRVRSPGAVGHVLRAVEELQQGARVDGLVAAYYHLLRVLAVSSTQNNSDSNSDSGLQTPDMHSYQQRLPVGHEENRLCNARLLTPQDA